MSSTATTTLSADDVRRLVMEPWYAGSGEVDDPPDRDMRPSLWARCPGCQPEGLEWRHANAPSNRDSDAGWRLYCPKYASRFIISASAAIDMILMAIARDAHSSCEKAWENVGWIGSARECAYDELTTAVMSTDLPGAVAARHRLKDLEDKS